MIFDSVLEKAGKLQARLHAAYGRGTGDTGVVSVSLFSDLECDGTRSVVLNADTRIGGHCGTDEEKDAAVSAIEALMSDVSRCEEEGRPASSGIRVLRIDGKIDGILVRIYHNIVDPEKRVAERAAKRLQKAQRTLLDFGVSPGERAYLAEPIAAIAKVLQSLAERSIFA